MDNLVEWSIGFLALILSGVGLWHAKRYADQSLSIMRDMRRQLNRLGRSEQA